MIVTMLLLLFGIICLVCVAIPLVIIETVFWIIVLLIVLSLITIFYGILELIRFPFRKIIERGRKNRRVKHGSKGE